MIDSRHWTKMDTRNGHHYYDADISADLDVQKIMIQAQGNLTAEGYWRDIATDLAKLVDTIKRDIASTLSIKEKKFLALAIQGLTLRQGPAMFVFAISLAEKLGLEQYLEAYLEDWIAYKPEDKST